MNGSPCKDSSNCENDAVCTMTYADENKSVPLGRFCKGGSDPDNEIVGCRVNSDCPTGECVAARDDNDNFIGRQCMEIDGTPVREGDYKKIDPSGTKYPHNKHISMERISAKIDAENGGPVAKMIAEIITLVIAIVEKALFLARDVFWAVFKVFGSIFLSGKGDISVLMMDTITKRIIPTKKEDLDKCKKNKNCPNCYSLWLIRNIYTILLPPWGVFMTTGIYGTDRIRKIFISCLLTALFYFPGLIYSLLIVNNNKFAEEEKKLTKCRDDGKVVKNTYNIEQVKILDQKMGSPSVGLTEVF